MVRRERGLMEFLAKLGIKSAKDHLRRHNILRFATSAGTYIVPKGTKTLKVTMVGDGGGGAGSK